MQDDPAVAQLPLASSTPALRNAEGTIDEDYVEAVTAAIEGTDADALARYVAGMHEADVGELLEAIEPELRSKLVGLLGGHFDFSALTEVDDTIRDEILEELPAGAVAAGVLELDSDDAVYLLEGLSEKTQAEILQHLPAADRISLERSLYYPDDSAGRRMQTEFIAVPAFWTVGQTIDHMRETPDLPDRFFELYVIDPAHRLLGTVALDRLLRTKRPTPISDLMDAQKRTVHATDDQEEVARLFGRYDLVAVPVVDAAERLVGVITIDDVVDMIEEEAEEDIKALGGVQPQEQLSDNVWQTARGRFPWLFANMLTAFLAASVIKLFEGSLEKMVQLAILMPIVASMGGNAGTQTMTVAVRALATRELTASNTWRIIRREGLVGVLNGIAFAVIIGIIAATWFHIADLGVVIGLAAITVLSAAAIGGIFIPLLLEKLGADPAVSSGPFVTTITDVVSFFSFLGIATLWFHLG